MSRTHSTLYHSLKELLDSKAITLDQIPPIKCTPWVLPAVKGFMDLPIMYKTSNDMFKKIGIEVDYSEIEKYGDSQIWSLEFLR